MVSIRGGIPHPGVQSNRSKHIKIYLDSVGLHKDPYFRPRARINSWVLIFKRRNLLCVMRHKQLHSRAYRHMQKCVISSGPSQLFWAPPKLLPITPSFLNCRSQSWANPSSSLSRLLLSVRTVQPLPYLMTGQGHLGRIIKCTPIMARHLSCLRQPDNCKDMFNQSSGGQEQWDVLRFHTDIPVQALPHLYSEQQWY